MAFPKFDYLQPKTIEDVCTLLIDNKDAIIIAGGTDLLIKLRNRFIRPRIVIGLKNVKGLDRITFNDKGLTIGAMALLSSVASHEKIIKYFPSVAYTAEETATIQIRNMGTVIGNLCNASPSADNAPPLMALDSVLTIRSHTEERKVHLEQFFKGPGITALQKGEIVTSLFVPYMPENSGDSYKHISERSKVDIPAASVGLVLTMQDDICSNIRIVLGAVGPTPLRALNTENMIKGNNLTQDLIEKAGIQASKESMPISDVRASAEYRKEIVQVLFKRAVNEALERIRKT